MAGGFLFVLPHGPGAARVALPVGTTQHKKAQPGRPVFCNEGAVAWIYLLIAGLLETAWAASLKSVAQRFDVGVAAFTAVAMGVSLFALYLAMARLPLGVAYPVWTGIGSLGAIVVSVLWFGQALSWQGVLGVVLLVAGMVLLGAEGH